MRKPLFKVIKETIQQQIEEGIYQVGDKIPTEMALAETFQTSRQTVNKALRDLVLDGVIERFPRSGSFVRKKAAQSSILDLKNIAEEIQERGNSYTHTLITLERVKATAHIAGMLEVVKDQEVYRSQMVHRENGVPVRFDIRYVKPSAAPAYIDQTFENSTPSRFLKQHCPVEKVYNRIEAIMPSEEMQSLLEIAKDEPCLKISRTVTSKGIIASYSELYYPSSRYTLSSVFSAS